MTDVAYDGVILQHLEYLTSYDVLTTGGGNDDICTWSRLFNRRYFISYANKDKVNSYIVYFTY